MELQEVEKEQSGYIIPLEYPGASSSVELFLTFPCSYLIPEARILTVILALLITIAAVTGLRETDVGRYRYSKSSSVEFSLTASRSDRLKLGQLFQVGKSQVKITDIRSRARPDVPAPWPDNGSSGPPPHESTRQRNAELTPPPEQLAPAGLRWINTIGALVPIISSRSVPHS